MLEKADVTLFTETDTSKFVGSVISYNVSRTMKVESVTSYHVTRNLAMLLCGNCHILHFFSICRYKIMLDVYSYRP